MPKVPIQLNQGYDVVVYTDDHEPPHVHVKKDGCQVVIWLQPVRFGRNDGFKRGDLRKIKKLVIENKERCLEVWNEYHGVPSSEEN